MNWKVGDIAIIANDAYTHKEWTKGRECILISHEGQICGDNSPMDNAWKIQIDYWVGLAEEHVLRKPYDGHEPCSWEKCVWEPDLVSVSR